MGWLLAMIGIVSAGAVLLARGGASSAPVEAGDVWKQRAEALGLRLGAVGIGNEPLLLHESDGVRLTLRPESPLGWGPQDPVRVELRLPRGASAGLDLAPKQLPTDVGVPTGDPAFDGDVLTFGDEPVVAAALDGPARGALAPLVGRGLRWQDDRVTITLSAPDLDAAVLRARVASLRALVLRVRDRLADLPRSLADGARHDEGPVRLRCARHLAERWPQDFDALLPTLLRDEHDPLRLLAAQRAGRDGAHVLAELARDEAVASPLRVRALHAVAAKFAELVEAVAAPLLVDVALDTHAAEVLAVAGLHEHAPTLARRLRGEGSSPHVSALALFDHPCVEPTLLPLLEREPLRDAVVTGLARRGGRNSVERLLTLAADRSTPRELRVAAQDAVTAIQSRLDGAEAGRLAVLPEDGLAGALALAGQAGELALAQGGELSPSAPPSRVVVGGDEG